MENQHVPVMLEEVMNHLAVQNGGIYVDATLGGGGYTLELLKQSKPSGRVIGIDLDWEAVAAAEKRLSRYKERLDLHQSNFTNLRRIVSGRAIEKVNGIVADLGISSLQLDNAERGFSFKKEGPLDMRMDHESGVSAAELVGSASEAELTEWFKRYGEERYAKRIAEAILRGRAEGPILTTAALAQVIWNAVPAEYRRGKIHPATRAFQALRIVVNGELINLNYFLDVAPHILAAKGRLAVISFHSLEDRIVKHRFKELAAPEKGFRVVTKKPLEPSASEVRRNPRSRSAKLRVLEKL